MTKHKLGELIEVTRGASLPGKNYAEEGKLIRLTMGNFDYNRGGFKENTSKNDIYYNGEVNQDYILEKGDIITPLTEQAVGLLGSTALIPESGKYIQSQDVALVVPDESKIDRLFSYYLVSSDVVKKQLSAAAQQTKIRHTSPEKIKACTVWVPELQLQHKIGLLLYSLDQKIALNTRMNADLEAMAKQLYDYWFVQFDFPDENGRPYKSSGGKMVYNEALRREIPEGWEVKSIGDLCELNGRSLSSKDNFSIIKYLDTSNLIENNIVGFHYLKKNVAPSRAQRMVKDKTILYSTVRPLMRHYGIMNNPSKNVIASTGFVTLDTHYKNDAYRIYEFLSCDSTVMYLAKIAETAVSSYPSVNPDDIASLLLVAPDTNIIDMYYHSVDAIFQYSTEKQTEIKFLSNLRDSLLPMLMNGQVDVKCE